MALFLSPEWIAELDDAARAVPDLSAMTEDVRLVIEQRITAPDAPLNGDPEVVYHVLFDHGQVEVRSGAATEATVTFTQDRDVATAIATGRQSAQQAFMTGGLRVGGNLQDLLANQGVLSKLTDVFAAVRLATTFPAAPEV